MNVPYNFYLAKIIDLIKDKLKNRFMSDENLVNAFIRPLVESAHIVNKNNEFFWLDKGRTSRLMCRKDNIPRVLVKALEHEGLYNSVQKKFIPFIDEYFNKEHLSDIYNSLLKSAYCGVDCNLKLEESKFNNSDKDKLSYLLTDILFAVVKCNNKNMNHNEVLWRHGQNEINVVIKDIFKCVANTISKKSIIVIPVNTTFDVRITKQLESIDYPLVSENTLHGQWLIKCKESGLSELDIKTKIDKSIIDNELKAQEPISDIRHQIGTIATFEHKNTIYFLLAISKFDKYNVAHCSPEDIHTAIINLLKFYDRYGQGYHMYIPLIGTGRSRAGLTYKKSLAILKKILLSNVSYVNGKISIVIPEYNIELEENCYEK